MDIDEHDKTVNLWLLAAIFIQLEHIYQTSPLPAALRRYPSRKARPPCAPSRASPSGAREGDEWRRLLDDEVTLISQLLSISAPPPVITSRKVPNAASDGRKIMLNPRWAKQVTESICRRDGPCREALLRGIACHELAHHLREERVVHDPHAEELRADAWAAVVLTHMNTSIEPYARLVGEGRERASRSHPAPSRRREALERGSKSLPVDEIAAAGASSSDQWLGSSHPLSSCVCREERARSTMSQPEEAQDPDDEHGRARDDAERVEPRELPKLDEYVEDLIDPLFGTYSSRQVIRASADKMLSGFNGILASMREAIPRPKERARDEEGTDAEPPATDGPSDAG